MFSSRQSRIGGVPHWRSPALVAASRRTGVRSGDGKRPFKIENNGIDLSEIRKAGAATTAAISIVLSRRSRSSSKLQIWKLPFSTSLVALQDEWSGSGARQEAFNPT